MPNDIDIDIAKFFKALKDDDQEAGMGALASLVTGAFKDLRRIADALEKK